MLRPRIIPCLLLSGRGLVKTVRFKTPRYIGDPINAVRIFSAKEADEIIFLDIEATHERRQPPIDLVRRISDEATMPFAVGGGIDSLETASLMLHNGAEKVAMSTTAVENPGVIEQIAAAFGSQSVVAALDVKRDWRGQYRVTTRGGRRATKLHPIAAAKQMQSSGAGEILINDISRDGTMEGYDLNLIRDVCGAVSVPVIVVGGAGSLEHLRLAIQDGGASAAAAGSIFVYHGPRKAVLINYPRDTDVDSAFGLAQRAAKETPR